MKQKGIIHVPATLLKGFTLEATRNFCEVNKRGSSYLLNKRWIVKFNGEVVRDDFKKKTEAVAFIKEKVMG
jgi:hypothetical protein